MYANLIILAFILGMTYWFWIQGMFTGLLHLIVVIVSGAIAFAFWELIAYQLLGLPVMIANYAWALALILPFVLLVGLLRVAVDKLVPNNLNFPPLVANIGGAVFGLFSGTLTAGFLVIALSYLPLDPGIGGYERLAIEADGKVAEGQSLWLPVDTMTADFYGFLSGYAFHPTLHDGLADVTPSLADKAANYTVHRLIDPNASTALAPDQIKLGHVLQADLPFAGVTNDMAWGIGADLVNNVDNRLYIVETTWTREAPAANDGRILRVYPSQIRLIAEDERGNLQSLQPNAFTIDPLSAVPMADGIRRRDFRAMNSNTKYGSNAGAFGLNETEHFAWVFVIPKTHQPKYLTARNMRLSLPTGDAVIEDSASVSSMLGRVRPAYTEAGESAASSNRSNNTNRFGARSGATVGQVPEFIEITNRFPFGFSTNAVTGLDLDRTKEPIEVVEGEARTPRAGNISQANRIEGVYTPSPLICLRVKVRREDAQSLLGAARASAARTVAAVYIELQSGQKISPIAYALVRGGNEMSFKVSRVQMSRAGELPLRTMNSSDELYLYFQVPPANVVSAYVVGDTQNPTSFRVD